MANQIVQYTTPTITITFSTVDVTTISTAYLVFKNAGENALELDLSDATVDSAAGTLTWTLTQEQTGALTLDATYIVYCDWLLTDGTRGRSSRAVYQIAETGMEEVIS